VWYIDEKLEGKWIEGHNPDSRCVYIGGDAKTMDLFEKGKYNMENNPHYADMKVYFYIIDTMMNTHK
jgi:hypothetical protein